MTSISLPVLSKHLAGASTFQLSLRCLRNTRWTVFSNTSILEAIQPVRELFDYLYASRYMSHNMTKPTKWVCAQRRLRSAWASAQSDQCLRCALPLWVAKDPSFLHESSLGAHSFCWFCHVSAHISSFLSTGRRLLTRWSNITQHDDTTWTRCSVFWEGILWRAQTCDGCWRHSGTLCMRDWGLGIVHFKLNGHVLKRISLSQHLYGQTMTSEWSKDRWVYMSDEIMKLLRYWRHCVI